MIERLVPFERALSLLPSPRLTMFTWGKQSALSLYQLYVIYIILSCTSLMQLISVLQKHFSYYSSNRTKHTQTKSEMTGNVKLFFVLYKVMLNFVYQFYNKVAPVLRSLSFYHLFLMFFSHFKTC